LNIPPDTLQLQQAHRWGCLFGSDESATRPSVLCPANAGRYFAAVAGGPDFILKLVADNEVGRVNPKIPEMKENIRPASARPNKPETTVAGFQQSTNRHEADPSIGK
jgi:hypothetical protein